MVAPAREMQFKGEGMKSRTGMEQGFHAPVSSIYCKLLNQDGLWPNPCQDHPADKTPKQNPDGMRGRRTESLGRGDNSSQ